MDNVNTCWVMKADQVRGTTHPFIPLLHVYQQTCPRIIWTGNVPFGQAYIIVDGQ